MDVDVDGLGWSKALPSLAQASQAMLCHRQAGQAAWLSSKLINLILCYFRDIFFVNGGQQRQLQQHPHPFNSYGLKANDEGGDARRRTQTAREASGSREHSQVLGHAHTKRDTLKQFHLHFSLRLDRGPEPGQDRIGVKLFPHRFRFYVTTL